MAANAGDIAGMVAVLSEDITLWTDGGGKARTASLTPIHGAENVAGFLLNAMRRYVDAQRATRPAQINGQPGFLVYVSGRAHVAAIFEVRGGRIQAIYVISNRTSCGRCRRLPDAEARRWLRGGGRFGGPCPAMWPR